MANWPIDDRVKLTYNLQGVKFMADYKQMYLTLLDATEKAINELISAQRACEELYILSEEEEEKAQKAQIIQVKKD